MRGNSWGKLLSTSGSLASTLGKNNPFRYRGYVYDEETGFYYLQSRYYNPEVGRFISADVLLSTGQGVLGHNAYAYCLNNPVNMIDYSGHRSVSHLHTRFELVTHLPDCTEAAINTLNENLRRVEKMKKTFLKFQGAMDFYNLVKSKGDWDYKSEPADWMPEDGRFLFNGTVMDASDFGNLNYGFTGAAFGFSVTTLLSGAGYAALTDEGASIGTCLTLYDDPSDTKMILSGILLCYRSNSQAIIDGAKMDATLIIPLNEVGFLNMLAVAKRINGSF